MRNHEGVSCMGNELGSKKIDVILKRGHHFTCKCQKEFVAIHIVNMYIESVQKVGSWLGFQNCGCGFLEIFKKIK